MRGGTINYEMMSTTCVQNVGGNIPHGLGGGFGSAHILEARSPAPAWHHGGSNVNNPNIVVKQEPMDHDSGAYCSGSDGFHSSSPGGSENSRDSNPPLIPPYSTAHLSNNLHLPPYYSSTPLTNRLNFSNNLYHQNQTQPLNNINNSGFNPLTPPSFELQPQPHLSVSPNTKNVELEKQDNVGNQGHHESQDSTLTPCNTPPSDGNFPDNKNEEENHLRNLQLAFERNEMFPHSPKDSEEPRDSGDEDNKSDYELDEVDEQGLRIPRVNSHGKVKTFKCKQCEFVAVTKLDFWEHSKGHIKAEKLLSCPKCPFVTEYKHHLEYHLRNHFGSKPFKCDKCNYSCVNKSMLNSHLKSHSNIYQYRCADCTYATKYCHSLKLHLRKYKHNPAMVLNPDGTPNPLPIIDVYGTRRGPKQKPQKQEDDTPTTPPSLPLQTTSPTNFLSTPTQLFPHFMLNSSQSGMPIPFPYNHLLGAFPGSLNTPLLFPKIPSESPSPNPSNDPSNDRSTPESLQIDETFNNTEDHKEIEETGSSSTALDLSKPEVIKTPEITSDTPVCSSIGPAKSRRKGKAFKLERISKDHNSDCEDFLTSDNNEEVVNVTEEDLTINNNEIEKKSTDIFNCQYCDITFKDIIMYTMHMGYHGYKDPFTCNMCGEQSVDKVSFFLHIARTSHS